MENNELRITEDNDIQTDTSFVINNGASTELFEENNRFCRRCRALVEWTGLQDHENFYDAILKLPSGTEIKVNRTLLSAYSEYFRASFKHNSNENLNVQTVRNVISINAPDDVMKTIVQFVNTGSCSISWANVGELLITADRYAVLGLVRQCGQFLVQQLNPKNCVGIFIFASNYLLNQIALKAREYILTCFDNIIEESNELQHLSFHDLSEIISNERLNVQEEQSLFHVIKKWIDYDLENRSCHLLQLVVCMRIGLIPNDVIKDTLRDWDLFRNNSECQKALKCSTAKPRLPFDLIFVLGGWSNGSPTDHIEVYNSRVDSWRNMRRIGFKRAYHALCAVDRKIYVIGGFDGECHHNWVGCYDTLTYKWEERACMYQARCYLAAVVHDNNIYAIGGYNGYHRLNSVERYSIEKNQWERLADMNQARSSAGACVMENKIYVAGGMNGRVLNSCEFYDVSHNVWTSFGLMLFPRSGLQLVTLNDSLYAIGGYSGDRILRSIEKFSVLGWNSHDMMSIKRSNFAAVVINKYIYVIGGYDGQETIGVVERFEPETKIWKTLTSLNCRRSGHCACVVSNLPNVKNYVSYNSDEE